MIRKNNYYVVVYTNDYSCINNNHSIRKIMKRLSSMKPRTAIIIYTVSMILITLLLIKLFYEKSYYETLIPLFLCIMGSVGLCKILSKNNSK